MNVTEFTHVQRVLLAHSYVAQSDDSGYYVKAWTLVGDGVTIVPKLLDNDAVLTGDEVVALYEDTQEDLCLGDSVEACDFADKDAKFGSHHKEGDSWVLTHPEMYSPAIGAALTLLANHPTMREACEEEE
jgi:hypothetical protein